MTHIKAEVNFAINALFFLIFSYETLQQIKFIINFDYLEKHSDIEIVKHMTTTKLISN